jgi:cytochrome c553
LNRRAACTGAVLALFFANGARAADATVAAKLVQCAVCHGDDGNSPTPGIPSLAGQPQFFLLNQLVLMREGVRDVPVMRALLKDLDDTQIEAIATEFSGRAAKPSGERIDPGLAERGAIRANQLRCASCHLPSFAGQDQMPRLAKQRIDYMLPTLKAFRDNTRSGADTMMSAVVFGVSDADLEALAHYVASK